MTRLQARTKIEAYITAGGPYWHNLVACVLGNVQKRYGDAEVNRMIKLFHLDRMGWRIVPIVKGKRGPAKI